MQITILSLDNDTTVIHQLIGYLSRIYYDCVVLPFIMSNEIIVVKLNSVTQ